MFTNGSTARKRAAIPRKVLVILDARRFREQVNSFPSDYSPADQRLQLFDTRLPTFRRTGRYCPESGASEDRGIGRMVQPGETDASRSIGKRIERGRSARLWLLSSDLPTDPSFFSIAIQRPVRLRFKFNARSRVCIVGTGKGQRR